MANNRIYLHCKGCGKELFLGKRFAGGFYYENYTPEEGTLEEKLNKFYSEHEFCNDEPLECFEIQYEFESTPEQWIVAATFERCPFCGYETGKRGGMTNYCPDCGKRLMK